jgi:RimJ/RimL family protein N-acetyltransferase
VHPEVHGEGVRLVPTAEEDLELLVRFFARPDILEYWDGEPMSDTRVAEDYIGRRSPAVECFLVIVGQMPVGFIQYAIGDDQGSGGIDLVLMKEFRGRGIGRAAVHALVRYLQQERGWNRITVDPDLWNGRALAFWAAIGFRPVQLVEDEQDRDPYWLMEYRSSRPANMYLAQGTACSCCRLP